MSSTPGTVQEFLRQVACNEQIGQAWFLRSRTTETDGIYRITVVWSSSEMDSQESVAIPEITPARPLTGAEEFECVVENEVIRPGAGGGVQQAEKRGEPAIALFKEDSEEAGEVRDRAIEQIRQTLGEVHLPVGKLCEFVTGGVEERVSAVKVSTKSRVQEQMSGLLALTGAGGFLDPQSQTSLPSTDGEYMLLFITLATPKHKKIDGSSTRNRFRHTQSLVVDGSKYPVDIVCRPFGPDTTRVGRWLHASPSFSRHSSVPLLNIDEAVEEIDWDAFFTADEGNKTRRVF
jgi:hypothetical protein